MCDEAFLFAGDSKEENNDDASQFSDLYKYSNRTTAYSLEKKRELFLQEQKIRRNDAFNEKRNLSELFSDEEPESMECETFTKPRRRRKIPFGFKLMGAEWLTEIPEDLKENWLMKLCLIGVRYLVVANKAITTCYYRNGKASFRFKSKLPGGSPETAHKFTLLDCVYNKDVNTLFVYDVLAWNSASLLNAEAHMRFYWLKSKFEEEPEMLSINYKKKFNFVVIDFLPADKLLLQDNMFTPFVINNQELIIDGVLFYHREGHYVFKKSPLVGWLRTFMLAEVLQIDVHPLHLSQKPENYENVQQFLSMNKKKKKQQLKDEEMGEDEESVDME